MKSDNKDEPKKDRAQKYPKKQYDTPKMTIIGSVERITRSGAQTKQETHPQTPRSGL